MSILKFFLDLFGFQKAVIAIDAGKILKEISDIPFSERWLVPRPSMFFSHDAFLRFNEVVSKNDLQYILKDPDLQPFQAYVEKRMDSELKCVPVLTLDGIEASKTWGDGFHSLNVFAQWLDPSRGKMVYSTPADLRQNLEGVKERNNPAITRIVRLAWSDRTYFINDGASHHLAAAYRYCLDHNDKTSCVGGVPLEYSLSSQAMKFMGKYFILGLHGGDNDMAKLRFLIGDKLKIPNYLGYGFLMFSRSAYLAVDLYTLLIAKQGVFSLTDEIIQ